MSLDWGKILDPNEIVQALVVWVILGVLGFIVLRLAGPAIRQILPKLSAKLNLEYAKHHYAIARFKMLDDDKKILYLLFIRARLWKRHRELLLNGGFLLMAIWGGLSQVDEQRRLAAIVIIGLFSLYVLFLAWKDAEYSLLYNEINSSLGEILPKAEFDAWYADYNEAKKKEVEQ